MADTNEGFEQAAVVVTLKGGSGYEAPWVVLRGNTATEAHVLLEEASNGELLETVGTAAVVLQKAYQGALPAPQTNAAAPAANGRPPLTGQGQADSQGRVFLKVPPPWENKTAKDEVKALGGRYDGDTKQWFVKPRFEPDYLTKFAAWL